MNRCSLKLLLSGVLWKQWKKKLGQGLNLECREAGSARSLPESKSQGRARETAHLEEMVKSLKPSMPTSNQFHAFQIHKARNIFLSKEVWVFLRLPAENALSTESGERGVGTGGEF